MPSGGAGSYNKRLIYEQPVETPPDAYGQRSKRTDDYAPVATYWASVRSPNGREALIASQLGVQVSHVVAMRWPGFVLDPKYRLRIPADRFTTERNFYIHYCVNVDEANRELMAFATETVKPQGA